MTLYQHNSNEHLIWSFVGFSVVFFFFSFLKCYYFCIAFSISKLYLQNGSDSALQSLDTHVDLTIEQLQMESSWWELIQL